MAVLCVCCISWTVLYQPLTASSMGEFVRGSITQLNAGKHFSKEMMNTICGAAIQLPSISPAEKKFIDVNTLCLNFQHIIRIILPEFPYFRNISFEPIWEGELKLWWTGSNFHLNWILFLPFSTFNSLIFEALSHVGVGSWQGWRWSRKEEKPQRILFPPQTNPQTPPPSSLKTNFLTAYKIWRRNIKGEMMITEKLEINWSIWFTCFTRFTSFT